MDFRTYEALTTHSAYLRQLAADEGATAAQRAWLAHLLRAALATARERVEQ